jgi:hypothetical protein
MRALGAGVIILGFVGFWLIMGLLIAFHVIKLPFSKSGRVEIKETTKQIKMDLADKDLHKSMAYEFRWHIRFFVVLIAVLVLGQLFNLD